MPNSKIDTSAPGVYRVVENGIAYHLDFRQLNNYKISGKKTVSEWYNSLNKFAKKEIHVIPWTEQ